MEKLVTIALTIIFLLLILSCGLAESEIWPRVVITVALITAITVLNLPW